MRLESSQQAHVQKRALGLFTCRLKFPRTLLAHRLQMLSVASSCE